MGQRKRQCHGPRWGLSQRLGHRLTLHCPKNLITKADAVTGPVRSQSRHRPASGASILLQVSIGTQRSRNESAGVGLGGVVRHLPCFPFFDEVALLKNRDPRAHVPDDREIVSDEQVGHATLTLKLEEQIQDLGLNGQVESGDGLIAHDEPRLGQQCARDGDSLALATRELSRELLQR